MPAAVWSGHLHFGLVVMHVRLLVAARPNTTKFRRIYRRPNNEVKPPMQLSLRKPVLENQDLRSEQTSEPDVQNEDRESTLQETQFEYAPVRQVFRSQVTRDEIKPSELVK